MSAPKHEKDDEAMILAQKRLARTDVEASCLRSADWAASYAADLVMPADRANYAEAARLWRIAAAAVRKARP